ncbi:MAG: UDPGP type 1 family protein [Lentisphaeria bacterium]|nr:UDPGP type 1 family protein [Lentisphaeria bacterium]
MPPLTLQAARELLSRHNQAHVLAFFDQLDEAGKQRLLSQLSAINWDRIDRWIDEYVTGCPDPGIPEGLQPAPYFPLIPETDKDRRVYDQARKRGVELLTAGKVAAFTVAGGQGTRLGYDAPKGTYPISPVKGKSLFQLFSESIFRAGEKYGHSILWVIMTSPMNDADTRAFFKHNRFFGLDPADIIFCPQGTMPAFDMGGKLILSARDSLALSPNGHGGSLLTLRDSGALSRMAEEGIEHITYFQVDNPLVQPFDPLFLGLHDQLDSDMSCRSLTKTGPFEKLGNFCVHDTHTVVIEYSDMPDDLATLRNERGGLAFRAGSPAIHVLKRSFVERLTADGSLALPFHRAEKKIPHLSLDGESVITPETANGIKLEMFIFDALPLARNVLILEADRAESFGPVKNPTGVDSVESCRDLLVRRDVRWLAAAGIQAPLTADGAPDCLVELSPASFLDPEDVAARADELTPPARGEEAYFA